VSSRPHILLVDDDKTLLEALSAILEGEGYRVSAEPDGLQALDWLHKNEPPSMILLDVRMPRMNGWSFWSRVRFMKTVAKVPVMLISADSAVQERAHSIGAAGFIAKPFSIEELLRKIEAVIRPTPSSAPNIREQ
jgi:DNA-binding response OmpR family regulator